MKKQIHPAAKAYLIRGAFYLLLLLALPAIPFALAQSRSRGTTDGSAAKHGSTLPVVPQFSRGTLGEGLLVAPPAPEAPQTVLYDQYNNAGANVTLSDFFSDILLANFSADLADDFVVPAGQTWAVQSIDADGTYFVAGEPATDWNVFFYSDNAGLPGAQVYNVTNQPVHRNGTTFTINLPTPAMLSPGTYWVEVQANVGTHGGQWGWTNRTVRSNSAASWQNPGGSFGFCQSWSRRAADCRIDPAAPDQVYRLNGTIANAQLGNISTRAFVQTGDNVMIGGFIVQGTVPKRVIIRAIGPELAQYGVPHPMADPTLELHNGTGALIGFNDHWRQTIIGGIITGDQVQDIINSGLAPGSPAESAIIADLTPGNYTAIVRGANNTTGVALAEVYNLSNSTDSILRNISTRSFVQTGDNIMIGGFIVQGSTPRRVIIRAIGPELSPPPYNIPNALADPTLELHNGAGALIASNNNWMTTIIGGIITTNQVQDIMNSGHAPSDSRESAIIANLQAGSYTAIVRGVNNTTGIALAEVYDLQ